MIVKPLMFPWNDFETFFTQIDVTFIILQTSYPKFISLQSAFCVSISTCTKQGGDLLEVCLIPQKSFPLDFHKL